VLLLGSKGRRRVETIDMSAGLLTVFLAEALLMATIAGFGKLAIRGLSDRLDLPQVNRDTQDATDALGETKRRRDTIEHAVTERAQEITQLDAKIKKYRKEMASPQPCQVDIVFEIGSAQLDGHRREYWATRQAGNQPAAGLRAPDPALWHKPRKVRVWGLNGHLCLSMAQQRFGTKRDFVLTKIEDEKVERA
jgi:hypothetical protein